MKTSTLFSCLHPENFVVDITLISDKQNFANKGFTWK